jgi:uncharacterized protein YgbK (DUF1537 family)
MTGRWRILADDLTGAADTLAGIGNSGASIHLFRPPGVDTEPISVLCTATRDCAAGDLQSMLAQAATWLAKADLPYKKVDSLLRGNTFAELAALLRAGTRLKGAVFVPAFPAQGRFTQGDCHWTAPPGRSHDQPRQIVCASLVQAFAAVGVTAKVVRSLVEPCEAEVVIPAAVTDADLANVAAFHSDLRYRDWLWSGSAGLAGALASTAARDHDAPAVAIGATPPQGPVPVITCSRHPVLRRQLECLQAAGVRTPLFDLTPAQELTPAQARAALRVEARHVVERLPRPTVVAVVGGDTLLALCEAAGAYELISAPTIRPGWGCLRLSGGRWDGAICHSRSGAFGGPADLLELLQTIGSR